MKRNFKISFKTFLTAIAAITVNAQAQIDLNSAGSVGIGTGSSITANTKSDLLYSTGSAFAYNLNVFGSHNINSNTGQASGSTGTLIYGVYGESNGNESSNYIYHYGGAFKANNSYRSVGVSSVATAKSAFLNTCLSYGGYFNSSISGTTGSSNAYGVYTTVASSTTDSNYGIYAIAGTGGTHNYAGYFSGDVYTAGGSNSGTGYLVASDQKFKTSINNISNPTDILRRLSPKSYFYDTTIAGMRFSSKKQYGFIAQDLQKVLPELVYSVHKPADVDSAGTVINAGIDHLAVNYDGFIALLTASVQQHDNSIDSLTRMITMYDSITRVLQAQINNCCNTGNKTNPGGAQGSNQGIGSIDVQLGNTDVIVLNQNNPNPFAEQTLITFNIPHSILSAQILFYDVNGRQIKSVDILKRGLGQLNVYANDLTNGIYSYTLIADGKIIDTKKMVKQQ